MLQLLQQRIKLSSQIGEMKRRHGAVVYVPDRERELVARLVRASQGQPPARVVAALYREILSSSRAAQGQAPVGLLQASLPAVLPAARSCFGACDEFLPQKNWARLVRGLEAGSLSLALLSGEDLAGALQTSRRRSEFLERFTVAADFPPVAGVKAPLAQTLFVVTPQAESAGVPAGRILILIECKSTVNAIKSLLHAMADSPFYADYLTPAARPGNPVALARLTFVSPFRDGTEGARRLLASAKTADLRISILGMYPGTGTYGG